MSASWSLEKHLNPHDLVLEKNIIKNPGFGCLKFQDMVVEKILKNKKIVIRSRGICSQILNIFP